MKRTIRILLVDSSIEIFRPKILAKEWPTPNVEFSFAKNPEECRTKLIEKIFDLVLLDMFFEESSETGLQIISDIRSKCPAARICIHTYSSDDRTLLKTLEVGATDFFPKTFENKLEAIEIIKDFLFSEISARSDLAEAKQIAEKCGIISKSKLFDPVFKLIMIARQNPDLPVLILGETGAGKEKIAKAINFGLNRPFVDVDCGAICETLAESDLFGHVKGSFSGAFENKTGKFQLANNGDLFFDEVGNLKYSIQEKSLRAIQNQEITPVGSNKSQKINVRIIAATNEDLDKSVEAQKFRADFLHRVKGIVINVPPLRDRPEDVIAIAENVVATSGKPHLKISHACLSIFRIYSWPGNVRELIHTVKQMIAHSSGESLSLTHLPSQIKNNICNKTVVQGNFGIEPARIYSAPTLFDIPLTGTLADANNLFYKQYLDQRCKAGMTKTKDALAKELGISRVTFNQHLRKYGVVFV